MTQEEKAKRYDEAISIAREYDFSLTGVCAGDVIQDIFPELKESEDEKKKKGLLALIEWSKSYAASGITTDDAKDMIAWLEKQGEQNLANSAKTCKVEQNPADLKTKAGNWYTCDMEVINENMETVFHRNEIYYCPKDGYLDVSGALFEVGDLDVFRLATEKEIPQSEQKPAWSEEDEKGLGDALWCCKQAASIAKDENDMGNVWFAENWLKSLKDRCTWKPSEEQMKALKEAVDEHFDIDGGALWHLYQELKILKE